MDRNEIDTGVLRGFVSSALQPGVVIGEADDGLTNVIAEIRDIQRGEVAGYNARVVGGFRELFPRLSRVDFENLQLSQLPEEEGALEDLVGCMRHLRRDEKQSYLSTRRMVRQDMGEGKSRLIIVPKVPRAMGEVELLSKEGNEESSAFSSVGDLSREELANRRKARTYQLSQVFNDLEVLQKYQLPLRAVETAKRIAATDPGLSARIFQGLMNSSQEHTAVTVVAGAYSRNRVQAANAIKQMCGGLERSDVSIFTLVCIKKFFMFGPGGEGDWFVSGPLKYAEEVAHIYWLVRHEGIIIPSVVMAMELVLLGIDIGNNDGCAEPQIDYHAGTDEFPSPVSGVNSVTASLLSVDARMAMEAMADRLLPVIGSNGSQIATAVRATGNYVLVNSHVVAMDSGCEINGDRVVVKSQLSRDLWSARCVGDSSPWLLREPVVGEKVVVCYMAEGRVSASAPLQITSIDKSCVVTTMDDSVTFGMSGGALVSLNDFALLGVHSASTLTNLLSYRFGATQFAELLESDSMSAFSRHDDVGSFAAGVVQHFERKGLRSVFTAAIDSMEPVFSESMHVGMLVNNGTHAYTTCHPDMSLRVGDDRRVAVFETVIKDALFRTAVVNKSASPVFRRAPQYFEKAFVLGFDDAPYISAETHVAHIGPDAKSFVLADLPALDKPVAGGIVMAWDGAVLGICGHRSYGTAVGLGYGCWPLMRDEVKVESDPRSVVSAAFPFLNLPAWSDNILEEVFTHSSVGRYRDAGRIFNAGCKPLANIGDNAAKVELYKSLREHSIPHSQWASVMQSLQSNAKFARVAWECGYAPALFVGSGVSMLKESKGYADLTEALIGAACLIENPETVLQLCRAMGIIYQPRPSFPRSISEFG